MPNNDYSHVLSPIQIGPMKLKNRVSFTPVWPSFATGDGHANRELMEWVRHILKGGVAAINIGCGCVNRNIPPVVTHLIRMSEETVVNELITLTDLAHMYNAKIGMELFAINFYAGSFADRDKNAKKVTVELDPTDLTKEQLHELIEDFAAAAERAMRCGFDSLVIHGAHGQLPGCFLSPLINERTDEYSCENMENATRFTRELLDAIRAKVGNKMAIEYRVNANDMVDGSPSVEKQIEFVKYIQDKIDLVHVSRGMHSVQKLAPYINQPLYFPHGINLEDAARFKAALDIPVTVVGSVTLEQAEEAIAAGHVDMVSMARGLMADPFQVKNAKKGCADKTRPCIRCNTCINKTHYYLAPIRCAVNAELGMETLYMNIGPTTPKKVAVIGGGAAGLEAARTAAARGHKVTVFEKSDKLGGVLNIAAVPEFKKDLRDYKDWSARSVAGNENIEVRMNTMATPEMIKAEGYDAVFVAIGSEPILPPALCKEGKTLWVGDVEMGNVDTAENVLVVGGGLTGCESALNLAWEGKKVTVVDVIPEADFGRGGATFNQIALRNMMAEAGVKLMGERKLASVTDEGVVLEKLDGTTEELAAEQVVLSLGVRPNQALVDSFADCADEVVNIGDCSVRAGTVYIAVHSGHEAASVL